MDDGRDPAWWIGGEDRPLTPDEQDFLAHLLRPGVEDELSVWLHRDPDDRPWLMVSLDVVAGGRILRTWRLDFETGHIVGGLSPGALNGDAGVRAAEAGVDPDVEVAGRSAELGGWARRWFDGHAR